MTVISEMTASRLETRSFTKEDFGSFKRYDHLSRMSLGERIGEALVNEALKFTAEIPAPEKLADRRGQTRS